MLDAECWMLDAECWMKKAFARVKLPDDSFSSQITPLRVARVTERHKWISRPRGGERSNIRVTEQHEQLLEPKLYHTRSCKRYSMGKPSDSCRKALVEIVKNVRNRSGAGGAVDDGSHASANFFIPSTSGGKKS